MTPGWWQQVYDLFSEALALEPDERNALLQRRCAGDPPMRAEVERLLASDARAELEKFLIPPAETKQDAQVLDQPHGLHILCPHCQNAIELVNLIAAHEVKCPSCATIFHLESAAVIPWSPRNGQKKLDRFELLEHIGSGAFGAVYRAHDPRLDRTVAVKVLRGATWLPMKSSLASGKTLEAPRSFAMGRSFPSMRSASSRARRSSSETMFRASPWPTGSSFADRLMTWRPAWSPTLPKHCITPTRKA